MVGSVRTIGRVFLGAASSLLLAGVSGAQGLSLEQAIQIAQQENLRVKAAGHGVEAADGDIRAARANYYPTMNFMMNMSKFTGDVFAGRFIVPPQPAADSGPFDSTFVANLDVVETVYSGGGHQAEVRGSRIRKQIAELDQHAEQAQLAHDVTKAYYDLLLADKSAEVARGTVRRSEETLTSVRKRMEEQEATKVELLGAETRLATDRQSQLNSENQRIIARYALNRLLRRDATADLQLTDSLEGMQDTSKEAEAIQQAMDSNPELQKARLQIDLAQTQIDGARSNFKPKLNVAGTLAYTNNDILFRGWNYGARIELSIPFFQDFGIGKGQQAQASSNKSAQEALHGETASSLTLAVQNAVRQVEEAKQGIEVAQANLNYYRERFQVSQTAYREQVMTFTDLLDDHTALARAELNYFSSLHRLKVDQAELHKLMGRR